MKLTYSRFPNGWTAEQIYEYLIGRAEEAEKAQDDVSDETTKENKT